MEQLIRIQSPAVPILGADIDTDVITPMNRLIGRSDKPLSYFAFEPLRFVGGDGDSGELDANFPLNQDRFRHARIMICGDNFGCGSSRESAPAVIAQLGFRCLIGSSFGDIFFNNCFQQGILPVVVDADTIAVLNRASESGAELHIDLACQEITTADGQIFDFEVNALRKRMLLEGLDDIGLTLQKANVVSSWQKRDSERRPWVYLADVRLSLGRS